jgi:hypothetical protein
MKYTLRINVEINQGDSYGNGLRVSENHEFEAGSFAELCQILTKFHELGEALKRAKK